MANKRYEPVSYRPFRTEPMMAEGLLAVARPGGEFLERVAAGFGRLADEAGAIADRDAERRGRMAGERAALEGRPSVSMEEGKGPQAAQTMTRAIPGDLRETISKAAQRHGVDPNTMLRIAMLESTGNPAAKNPNSSAGGLFQFVDKTAAAYGLQDRFDPAQASDAAARLARDNAAYLRRQLGREPTPGELYLAHQQGAGGAASLLRNPSADAAAIVGRDAVRLNGGRAGMTAGEFANLWIRKAEGGRGPAGEPSFRATGKGWKPTGADTIAGRAADLAGAKVYAQSLETEMRSTAAQVFDRYGDDPVMLEKALGALKGELAREHVFDEIRADYEIGFDSLAGTYMAQARKRLQTKLETQDRADFIERTGVLETELQRRVEEFDPDVPGASEALAGSLTAIDDHYDAAVDRGILDADDAATKKLTDRRATAQAFYLKQAQRLDAAGIATMREEMAEDFKRGELDGLDGAGWSSLDKSLVAAERRARATETRQVNALRKEADQQAVRVAGGLEPDRATLAKLSLEAGRSATAKELLAETEAKIAAARAIRDQTVPEGKASVAAMRKAMGDAPTEGQLRTVEFAERMLAEKEKAITTDPVTYAETQRIVPATPLLTAAEDPGQMQDIMGQRVEAADQAAAELGIRPRFLKAGEAAALAKRVREKPQEGAPIAAAIVAGGGARAAELLAEFGQDAPMIAEAGAILAFGGSARAAEDVIGGYGRADGKALKGLKPDAQRASFVGVTGGALAQAGQDRQRIDRAAAAITRKRIADEGLDPTSEEALSIHAQAVQEAAGAVFDRGVQFGGFADYDRPGMFTGTARVFIPAEIRADRFEDVVSAVTEADLEALPVKPVAGTSYYVSTQRRDRRSLRATLMDATPVAVRGGFAFALGDPASEDPQYISGEDGNVFVLDILSMRERLEARVPGAFR